MTGENDDDETKNGDEDHVQKTRKQAMKNLLLVSPLLATSIWAIDTGEWFGMIGLVFFGFAALVFIGQLIWPGRFSQQWSSPQSTAVSFDETTISCCDQQVGWADLSGVIIETTDEGPAIEDVFWVLLGDESVCIVPNGAEGLGELIERLQQRLPGFDNLKVVEAMGCSENATFVIWQRDQVADRAA